MSASPRRLGVRVCVSGLRFRMWGVGDGVWGVGSGVWGVGCGVRGLCFLCVGSGLRSKVEVGVDE